MAGRQADDQTNYHAREDGHDRLVYGPYALDLEVVRGAQRADEQHAEDAQAPSAVS